MKPHPPSTTCGRKMKKEDDIWNTLCETCPIFSFPPSRLVSTDNFPLVLFPQLWNNFDNVLIKSIVSKTEFNSKLKCYLLKDLSENV